MSLMALLTIDSVCIVCCISTGRLRAGKHLILRQLQQRMTQSSTSMYYNIRRTTRSSLPLQLPVSSTMPPSRSQRYLTALILTRLPDPLLDWMCPHCPGLRQSTTRDRNSSRQSSVQFHKRQAASKYSSARKSNSRLAYQPRTTSSIHHQLWQKRHGRLGISPNRQHKSSPFNRPRFGLRRPPRASLPSMKGTVGLSVATQPALRQTTRRPWTLPRFFPALERCRLYIRP